MSMEKEYEFMNQIKTSGGFTLVEALLSVVLLGFIAVGISAPYISGFQSLDIQADRMLLDSRLRGQMEKLVGKPFNQVSDDSDVVTVRGRDYTITWSVAFVDLNEDETPEQNAKQVTVSVTELPDRSLTTIIVDHEGRMGKIS